jgi:hypothetical protein
MKLTGPACTEAMSGVEEAGRREGAEDNAGGVRVEREVRPSTKLWPPEHARRMDSGALTRERRTMLPTPKERSWSYCAKVREPLLN